MIANVFNFSNYFFNPHALPYFISGILILAESIFIFLQNRKSILNFNFFLLTLFAGIWLTGVGFIYSSKNEPLAFFWSRYYSWLGIIFVTPAVHMFSIIWSGFSIGKRVKFIYFDFISALVIYIFCISTKYIISGLWKYPWGWYPKAGAFEGVFVIWFYALMSLSFRNFILAHKKETIPIKRKQIRLIIIAFIFGFIGSLDFLPNFGIPLYTFAAITVLFFSTTVAYTIIRYKLLDIETIIHKTLVWLAASSVIFIPIMALSYLLRPWYREADPLKVGFLSAGMFCILTLYLKLIQPKIDHFFHRRKYDLETASEKFILDLVQLKTPTELMKKIHETLSDTLYATNVSIQLEEALPDDNFLRWLSKNDEIIYRDFLETNPKYESIRNLARLYLEKNNAVMVIPLILNEKSLGTINLGKKSNLKRYNAYDFQFLLRLKSESTIAISNSLLYGRVEEEVKLRTEELMQVQKQLVQAEKLATVGTLAGGVAHEINNPLTAVLTNVQMLLMSDQINPKEDRESLELIEEATKRCRTIVQKLMAYAKKPLESADLSQIDLLKATKNVTSFLNYQLEQENIKVAIEAQEPAYIVNGNQNELEQVITNIILNGKDAIKKVKNNGEIRIIFLKSQDWTRVIIKDDGAGIADKIMNNIFDPFFTTKDVGKGLGLGLSICQAIMEKHNGLINVESEINKGATFTIQFPKIVKS